MAIEYRGNRTYYYRARRVNGRVVKEYIGGGYLGESLYQLERLDALHDAKA